MPSHLGKARLFVSDGSQTERNAWCCSAHGKCFVYSLMTAYDNVIPKDLHVSIINFFNFLVLCVNRLGLPCMEPLFLQGFGRKPTLPSSMRLCPSW